MKKILIVGINEKVHSTLRLIQALKKNNLSYSFIKWGSFVFYEHAIYSENHPINLQEFSAVFCDIPSYNLCLKKGTAQNKVHFRLNNELHELLKRIEKMGLSTLNRDFLIKHPFYNKFTQAQLFTERDIDAIPTFHLSDNKLSLVLASMKLFNIKFPLVVKQSEGGMGEFVWKANDATELEKILCNKRNSSLIYQPFVENSGDFRILIVDGKSLGVMKRTAKKGEWKNNFALGGKVLPHKDSKMEKFAQNVCQKMGLDYAGIDIFKTKSGYKVIEVNVFACFEGFEKVFTKADIPQHILNFLIK
jgi:RimK family alpha-L-glutamate ligase